MLVVLSYRLQHFISVQVSQTFIGPPAHSPKMSLAIEERIAIRVQEHSVLFPKEAVIMHDGQKYFKLMAHHPSVVKVFVQMHGLETPAANASLAAAQGLDDLKKKKMEAIAAALGTADEASSLFEPVDAIAKVAKARKADLPAAIVLDLDGVSVKFLCRGFHSHHADLVIEMDSRSLTAVFKYIHDHGFELEQKRSYKKAKNSESAQAVEDPEGSGSD